MTSKITFQAKRKKTAPKPALKKKDNSGDKTEDSSQIPRQTLDGDNSTIIILTDLNISVLDRTYIMSDIMRHQERDDALARGESKKNAIDSDPVPSIKTRIHFTEPRLPLADLTTESRPRKRGKKSDDDIKTVATSLETLGISTIRKGPAYTFAWGDRYKIRLFVSNGPTRYELTPETALKCHHCHHEPPKGALMLAVPYRYNPPYIHRHDYAPEWINVVKRIKVERAIRTEIVDTRGTKTKIDQKSLPKSTYFKRDLPAHEVEAKSNNRLGPDIDLIEQDHFDCLTPVCSFNCMVAKAKALSETNPRFRNVDMLIAMLHQRIFDRMPANIVPAAPFEVLRDYGGEFTIEEYRRDFQFVELVDTGQVFNRAKRLINSSTGLFSVNKE